MRIGKLTNQELKEIVLSRLPKPSARTLTGAQIGADCAWLTMGTNLLVTSSDPVTAGGMQSGRIAIHVSCNDIAASGVKPVGILLVIIAPPAIEREELISIVDQASEVAASLGVDIVGGHTEISDAVNRIVVTTTAFGLVEPQDMVPLGRAMPGDTLLITKTAALEGTWIAAMEHSDKLVNVLSREELDTARSFLDKLSVVKEGVLSNSCPSDVTSYNEQGYLRSAVHLMHDATEGGILGASYEMAELSGIGVIIDDASIPVHSVTRKISEALGLDAMRLISSGSLLIATSEPEKLMKVLSDSEILCTAIGTFTNEGFFTKDNHGKLAALMPPDVDDLYKLL